MEMYIIKIYNYCGCVTVRHFITFHIQSCCIGHCACFYLINGIIKLFIQSMPISISWRLFIYRIFITQLLRKCLHCLHFHKKHV